MRCAGALALVTAWLVSTTAFAQSAHPPIDGSNDKAADALFKEGRAAFDKGDFPTACAKFDASEAASPAPGTLLNLTVCEEKVGHLVASKKHLNELLGGLK